MTSDRETWPVDQGRPYLTELFELVGPQVRRYACVHSRRADPDDIVAETVLRLSHHLDRNPDVEAANLVPVALTIARHLVIDQSRTDRREVLLPAESLITVQTLREEDFADRRAEIIDALDALRALPEDLQVVVTLVCLDELSLPETARILGISLRMVQRRYKKGRERLRRALGIHR
ncbi:RNA polymerase sigma factor [Amycolatopsis kentuckyensis]|uniref:RNA polymerase sigma factor n=1 Tax=Amycolatopsis kentuckyensis TaxID=218823 RepID=UPI001302104D|nr:sigma-70 family RNA polymerase sigma factor [Amycolatopsis kentuckyensis]